jgi:hypothetical protein
MSPADAGSDSVDHRSASAEAYKLAYDEAIRSLTKQEDRLDELRSRTGTLVAAASIATSFLGAAALDKVVDWRDYTALALFGVTIALSLFVLFPLPWWEFSIDAKTFLRIVENSNRPTLVEIHRHVTEMAGKAVRHNEEKLVLVFIAFEAAAAALLIEIVFWALAFIEG